MYITPVASSFALFSIHFSLKFPTFQKTKNKHQSDAFMYVAARMQFMHKQQNKDKKK